MKVPSRSLETVLIVVAAGLLVFGLFGKNLASGENNRQATHPSDLNTSRATTFKGPARSAFNDFEKTTGKINPKDLNALSNSIEGMSYLLSINNISRLDPQIVYTLSKNLVTKAINTKTNPQKILSALFLSPSNVLAMMARDRDVADYANSASDNTNAGDSYTDVINLVPKMRPLRALFESMYKGAYDSLSGHSFFVKTTVSEKGNDRYIDGVALPGEVYKPNPADFKYTHTYALDIFFQNVSTNANGLEKGPNLYAMFDGIVVAASNSWKGGEGLKNYKGGGISPRAGNGVIYYSPTTEKYYSYFHMNDVSVKPGQAVRRGQVLGHGGNTGASARIPGHGGHVHVEIYDALRGTFLTNTEEMAIIFN